MNWVHKPTAAHDFDALRKKILVNFFFARAYSVPDSATAS